MRINTFLVFAAFILVFTELHVAAEDKVIQLEPGASCIAASCHDNMGKKKYAHAIGIDGKKCYICHEIIKEREHLFQEIPVISEVLCAKCHEEELSKEEKAEKKAEEASKEKPERKSLSLEDIIDQLPEETPPPEKETPMVKDAKPPKVISRSDDLILHKPFAEGKCTECHNPHESDNYRHLKMSYPVGVYAKFSTETYSLCFTNKCHKGLEYSFLEPRDMDLTLFRNGNLNLHFRHVNRVKGRTCIICHHNHGTANPKLIKDNFQFGNRLLTIGYEKTETGGKCATTCHRTALYDRYEPKYNVIKTSPRIGTDATKVELMESKERDMKRAEEKTGR